MQNIHLQSVSSSCVYIKQRVRAGNKENGYRHMFTLYLLSWFLSCQHIWCISLSYQLHIRWCCILLKFRLNNLAPRVFILPLLSDLNWRIPNADPFLFWDMGLKVKHAIMIQEQFSQVTFFTAKSYFWQPSKLFQSSYQICAVFPFGWEHSRCLILQFENIRAAAMLLCFIHH